jgi:DNA ligase-4
MTSVRGQKLSQQDVDSEIFRDVTFCKLINPRIAQLTFKDVIKGDPKNNKAALEALVHKHGGDFTQAQLSDNTAMVIAPDEKGGLYH